MRRILLATALALSAPPPCPAAEPPVLALDFGRDDPAVQPRFGARRTDRGLECVTPLQHAEVPFARKLDGADAVTVCTNRCVSTKAADFVNDKPQKPSSAP
jgi:hypothetical protein